MHDLCINIYYVFVENEKLFHNLTNNSQLWGNISFDDVCKLIFTSFEWVSSNETTHKYKRKK
jgi:hypothetical protein